MPPLCNGRLRATREATPSRQIPGRALTRSELAALVVEHVWEHHGVDSPIDRKYIAKLEAGRISWPNTRYREALRAILGVAIDEALGFHSTNVVRAAKALTPIDQRDAAPGPPCPSLDSL